MKKKLLMILILVVSLLFGCKTKEIIKSNEDEKITVYTSFYTMYDFTLKIGGDKINLVNLMSDGGEVHDWEPTTIDIISLEQADILIYNGAGMETWIDKVINSLDNENFIAFEASAGIEILTSDDDGVNDPHVWLSINNAKTELMNIKDILSEIDPGNALYYEENYNKYASIFDELNNKYIDTISSLENKSIVVSHEAYGYLCHEYGLEQVGISGIDDEGEPNPKRMAEIVEFIKENNINTIFFEDLAGNKIAKTIAEETGANIGILNTLEGLTGEQVDSGEDYISIMEKNLESLKAALM